MSEDEVTNEDAEEWDDWQYVRPFYEREGFYRRNKANLEAQQTMTLKDAAIALNAARTALAEQTRRREEAEGKARLWEPIIEALTSADETDRLGTLKVDVPLDGYPRQWLMRYIASLTNREPFL